MDENGNALNTCPGEPEFTIPFLETLFYKDKSGTLDTDLDADRTIIGKEDITSAYLRRDN